jgi:small-conductance mechanosensitive channel
MQTFELSLDTIVNGIVAFLPRLGLAILVYLAARMISAWVSKILRRSMEQRDHDPELIVLLEMITRWSILALGVVLSLEQLAPGRFTGLIAGLGIAGFTIGFALQDVAKNFVAGILLLIQQPFGIGDAIEVAGYGGTVVDISLRSTDLQTWDGRHVLIPNGDVFVSPIVNFSRGTHRRVQISVGVAYDSDLDKVTRVALDAIKNAPGLLQDPAPSVIFSTFSDSAIEFSAYYWIDTDIASLGIAQDTGIKAIKDSFARESIEIPYPIRTVITAER